MNEVIVEDVSKSFQGKKVLSHISVNFKKGEIHGVIGRNGSGKTVLMKIICGLIHPDCGTVTVSGKKIGKEIDFPESVGAIIEAPGFLPHQSAYKNLCYLASLRGIIGKDRIRWAIESVGLNPDDKKPVGKYSLGMKQRLGIAQAIMEDPELLILDEPMNGLDNEGVRYMRDFLMSLRDNGKTIILSSHSQEDIDLLCDQVYLVDAGVLTVQRKKLD